MSYVSQVPNAFFTMEADLYVVDLNQMHLLNDLFYNEKEITGGIVADNVGNGNPNVAEPGEMVTIPTASGPVSGNYSDGQWASKW